MSAMRQPATWLIVEVVLPELQPTRFARRVNGEPIDIDAMLFKGGIATAKHDDSLPYPKRYPLTVFSWEATAHDAPRPETAKKTRARHATYKEACDRAVALRKAAPWGRPRVKRLDFAERDY